MKFVDSFVDFNYRRPKDLLCPVTNELLVESEFPIYRTEVTGKVWEYDQHNNVFKETSGRLRTFRWTSSKWIRVKRKLFESTIGRDLTIGSSYVKYPTTNWDGLKLVINNFVFTNSITLSAYRMWRYRFPMNLKFPLVTRIEAKTVANELVSVQPMSAPMSSKFFLDTKDETKRKEHVIIIDELTQE